MKKLNDKTMSQVVAAGSFALGFARDYKSYGFPRILSLRYQTLRILPRLMGFRIRANIYAPTLVMSKKVGKLEAFDIL